MSRLFRIQKIPLTRVNNVFVVLVVLGLGGVIEIVEYIVVLTVPAKGVGGYDKNMQDLMANVLGATGFMLAKYVRGRNKRVWAIRLLRTPKQAGEQNLGERLANRPLAHCHSELAAQIKRMEWSAVQR